MTSGCSAQTPVDVLVAAADVVAAAVAELLVESSSSPHPARPTAAAPSPRARAPDGG
ncbi:hypothetical protein [Cryptosporangium aurantiacum]|uniref:hypothetical protein n=1 Tax=Cryptosporangium aurantiacum TaxID=134849 RepID=UPI001C4A0ACC|nr:hypothetical protein [Cryptosporangium aurantiacum]